MADKIIKEYQCPSCGKKHNVELSDPDEYYDGLCLQCEAAWVNSEEYKFVMNVYGY